MYSYLKKKVMIIEDNNDLRTNYALLINGSDKFQVIGVYESFEEAFPMLSKHLPDIILMDIQLPGKNGIEAVRIIKEKYSQVDVVMVTAYDEDELVFESLKAGASGYITKSGNFIELLNALEEIQRGGAPMSSKIAKMVIHTFHIDLNSPLSNRERQILQMVSVGKTYTQISEELNISKETSKTHIRNIYTKLQVHCKSEAVEKATKARWI